MKLEVWWVGGLVGGGTRLEPRLWRFCVFSALEKVDRKGGVGKSRGRGRGGGGDDSEGQ